MSRRFWHVSEHLFALARALHNEHAPQAKAAGERWKTMLHEGQVQEEIVEELEELRRTHRGAKRKKLGEELRYRKEGKHRMDYPRYRAEVETRRPAPMFWP